MADLLGMLGFGSFVAISLAVGIRLLLLARRTRRFPELAIGLDFVLAGAVGYGLLLAAESLRLLPAPYDGWASFVGVTSISVGTCFLALFTRRVFRPESRVTHLALVALVLWLALGVYGSWVLHVRGIDTGIGGWLGAWGPNLGLFAAYGWSSLEPLRHRAQLRRRARIGIDTGDAMTANRMLLWALGAGAIAAIAVLHLVAQLFGHFELPPSLVGVVSMFALVAAVAEGLAFFPPRAYRNRFIPA